MWDTYSSSHDNDLSVSLLGCGLYTMRTHCDTLRKFNEQ